MDLKNNQLDDHKDNTGSSDKNEPVFLVVGRIRRAHGLKGEMIMDVLTDFPERITPGKLIYVADAHEPQQISSVRSHDNLLLISFKGIDNKDDLARYRNSIVYVKTEGLPDLPENEFYHHDLIGMTVIDEQQKVLGKLVEIMETGANDVYVIVNNENNEILIPAVDEFILSIDLAGRLMTVHKPEWSN